MSAVTLVTLLTAAQPDPLTRRELACVRARFSIFRRELAERVQCQIAEDATTPIASNQKVIRALDAMIAALDAEAGSGDRVLAAVGVVA